MDKRKRALGRGLDSLIPTKKDFQFQMIPVERIMTNKYQPRKKIKKDQSFEELVQSIKEKGIIEPIIVSRNNGKYVIIAGERRYRAAIEAGLMTIPAVIREDLAEKDLLELAIIENIHREDLNPIEEARAFSILIEKFNYTHEELAEKLSVSRPKITNLLRLLHLPEEIQFLIENGELTEGHARALLSLEEQESRIQIAREIIKNNLSVRQTEQLIKNIKQNSTTKVTSKQKQKFDPNLRTLAERLTRTIQGKVEIKGTTQKGKIIIHYHSSDDLDKIADQLMKLKSEE